MINQQSFMFNSRFEKTREYIINNSTYINMLYLGTRAFEDISGEKVRTCAFVKNEIIILKNIKLIISTYRCICLKKKSIYNISICCRRKRIWICIRLLCNSMKKYQVEHFHFGFHLTLLN